MGGNAHVIAVGAPSGAVERAAERLGQVEARWSRFRSDSEVSRLGGGVPVRVSEDTVLLVQTGLAAWRLTDGAFDPTVLQALEALGYDRSFEQVLAQPAPDPAATPSVPGCDGITCDPHGLTVTVPLGCRFDPGGIGKGLAADLVSAELMQEGASGCCVNVGGDLRVRGASPNGGGWEVGVDDPHQPGERLQVLELRGAGLASSSRLLRRWGSTQHHLIDPATGRPTANDLVAVSVAADDAALAESLTKAAFVLQEENVLPLLERVGAAGMFVYDDGRVSRSSGWPTTG